MPLILLVSTASSGMQKTLTGKFSHCSSVAVDKLGGIAAKIFIVSLTTDLIVSDTVVLGHERAAHI